MPPAAHCRFSADPDACSAPDAPHPTKKIQRSPAGRDQSTGADSSLCNKSGSSSTLKRLVCASGGRRTMANSMRYGARCSTQSTSSPLPAPKMEESLAHCQTLRPWSVPPAGDERWKTLSSMVHDAACSISSPARCVHVPYRVLRSCARRN